MTSIKSSVSFLAQSEAQVTRLLNMRRQMDDLSRQAGTQKKYDTLDGFGLGTKRILELHADFDSVSAYSANIDSAISNMNFMVLSMGKMTDSLNGMISFFQTQPQNNLYDTNAVRTRAGQMIDFVTDVANVKIGGRYLFSGSDASTEPIADRTTLKNNFAGLINDWMAGTITTDQLIANADALTGPALGLAPSLSGAQDVTVQIDKNLEISYGAVADRSGIEDVLSVLSFMTNLRPPNPATDVPTTADFERVMNHILSAGRSAVDKVQLSQGKMTGSIDLATNINETHKQDINLFGGQIIETENADPAEVIVKLQALQTQINASYQVTRILSELSLANVL